MRGIQALTECVAAIPQIRFEPWPSCQISVITPHDAATLITLRMTAFSGSSSERNARASRMNVRTAMIAIIAGKLP